MADFADVIKYGVQNVLVSWNLTDYAAGTVVSTEPLRVKINERITLEPFQVLSPFAQGVPWPDVAVKLGELQELLTGDATRAALAAKVGELKDLAGRAAPLPLAAGDKLILLRVLRGQKYIILGKAGFDDG